jgi:uncharacterized protein (DUF1810 family)
MASNALERFRVVQQRPDSGHSAALAELRTTGKRGHWIWYVFPQLAGLGESSNSRKYGIHGPEEAAEYLRDPVLRSRLIAVTQAVAERLEGGLSLENVMGSRVDLLKLVSSLTLFERVARSLGAEASADYVTLADVAGRVLANAEAHGYTRCQFTLRQLGV